MMERKTEINIEDIMRTYEEEMRLVKRENILLQIENKQLYDELERVTKVAGNETNNV